MKPSCYIRIFVGPLLIAVAALLICACAGDKTGVEVSSKTKMDSLHERLRLLSCPEETDLRGQGVAESPQAAQLIAQKDLASQIQASVVAATALKKSETVDAEGNEILRSSLDINSRVFTRLENAQDARVEASITQNEKTGVVVCMSRENAVKPYSFRAKLLQDSLHLMAKTYEGAVHPLLKNKTYKKARAAYIRFVATRNVLDSFGNPKDEVSESAEADYAYMHEDFTQFLSSYAMYFATPKTEIERNIFSVVSQNFTVLTGSCSGGIVLTASEGSPKCADVSMGVKCSTTISLSGSSCEGETYFTLLADVSGVARYDKSEAMDLLSKNVAKAEWLPEWRLELNRWRMK